MKIQIHNIQDFNMVLDPAKDCLQYTNVNNPRAPTEVLNMMENKNLSDVFRELYPDQKNVHGEDEIQSKWQD